MHQVISFQSKCVQVVFYGVQCLDVIVTLVTVSQEATGTERRYEFVIVVGVECDPGRNSDWLAVTRWALSGEYFGCIPPVSAPGKVESPKIA